VHLVIPCPTPPAQTDRKNTLVVLLCPPLSSFPPPAQTKDYWWNTWKIPRFRLRCARSTTFTSRWNIRSGLPRNLPSSAVLRSVLYLHFFHSRNTPLLTYAQSLSHTFNQSTAVNWTSSPLPASSILEKFWPKINCLFQAEFW